MDIPSILPKKSTGVFIRQLLHKKRVLNILTLFDKKGKACDVGKKRCSWVMRPFDNGHERIQAQAFGLLECLYMIKKAETWILSNK